MKLPLFSMLLIFNLIGCAAPERKSVVMAAALLPEQQLFDRGVAYLESAKFEAALVDFETFLQKNPVSPLTPSAIFYSGIANENMGNFEAAEQNFRTTLRLSEGRELLKKCTLCFKAL